MEKCPKCGGGYIIGVEYAYPHQEHYDGISEYECQACGYRQGRWTGRELEDGESEPRYGKGK